MDGTLAIILAGGRGTRLGPLTAETPKPLLPFAGSYRLIDFAFTNCIESGVSAVLVLTGHLAGPVERYVDKLRRLLPGSWRGRVLLTPPGSSGRSIEGTAAAVQAAMSVVRSLAPRNVLILAADHVYRMDFAGIVERHRAVGAGVTVGSVAVPRAEAHHFGVLDRDRDGRLDAFEEKPDRAGADPASAASVSMGIYVFDRDVLEAALAADSTDPDSSHDFGRDVIPALVRARGAWSYPFDGYWRDLGTVDAYYRAHQDLLAPRRPIPFLDPYWPLLTAACPAPSRRQSVNRRGTLLCPGSSCEAGSRVRASVIGPAVRVGRGASLDRCIVLDGARIGEGARLRRVIVGPGETVEARTCVEPGSEGRECRVLFSVRFDGRTNVTR